MRLAAVLASLFLLSACSSVTTLREAWSWEPARGVAPVRDVSAPSAPSPQRVAELQAERAALRSRLAAEPDIWQRQVLYAQLHEVGRQLSPLERRSPMPTSLR